MKIEGLDALKRKLQNMKHIESDVAAIIQGNKSEAANIAATKAKAVMNKGYWTGNLARLIEADMINELSFRLTSTAHYSGYLEYGTRFMQAEPFMHPAKNEIKAQLRDDFKNLMKSY